ncbi:MAG: murein L,D-transpeptidase catalytic domain family protein [Ferruginibacter sp.]
MLVLAISLMVVSHPIAFSKSNYRIIDSSLAATGASDNEAVNSEKAELLGLYDKLALEAKGLTHMAFESAIKGFIHLKEAGKMRNQNILTIADFTLSSAKKRLFIIDMDNQKVLFNTYVAHGQKTGAEFAKDFSNRPESLQSSPGFYITSSTYNGKNGYSMHLMGQEAGINDKAYDRAIVMHGAPYVSESFIRARGYLGRSWGCPAVSQELTMPIIETIKNGTCLFIFSGDVAYLNKSKILNS